MGAQVVTCAVRAAGRATDGHLSCQSSLPRGGAGQRVVPLVQSARARKGKGTVSVAAFEDTTAQAAVPASIPAQDDPVVSVLFTLAVVALSVLTLGVAYLGITSFLDQRQEEDRKKAGYGPSKTDALGVPRPSAGPPGTTFDESAFQQGGGSKKKAGGKGREVRKKKENVGMERKERKIHENK